MATTASGSISSILDPAMEEIFIEGMITQSFMDYFLWCRVRSASTRTIEKVGVNTVGDYADHTEGGEIDYSAVDQGNGRTYTMSEVANGLSITSFSAAFMDQELLATLIGQMGVAAGRHLNSAAYDLLANSFTDTAAGSDGVSLCNNSHPLGGGGTYDNLDTTAIGYTSLQNLITILRKQVTGDGLLSSSVPAYLVCSAEDEIDARQLVESLVTDSNNQTNIVRAFGLQVLVAPDLSDATDHWLVSPDFRAYQYIAKGSNPVVFTDDDDSLKIKDRLIFSTGADDWRGLAGSQAA